MSRSRPVWTAGAYELTYLLPQEWMNAAERAYPVVLDPIVEADLRAKNIQDQTVAPGKNFNYLWGMVEAGYYAPYGVERFYMQYVDLPALTSADVVVQASISLYKLQKSSKSSQVNVHHVSGSWDSRTLQWSNRPDYDSRVQDYLMVQDTGWYTWDITDIAQKWYQTGNNGMLFKMPDSVENAAKEEWTQFCSADYSAAALPVLYITYINNCGLESYWDYTSVGAGSAGTGYISQYTGNLSTVSIAGSFGYTDNHLLSSVTDSGDYRLRFGYNTTASGLPNRVASVKENDGSADGGSLTISYAHNQTTFEDHNGNREIVQFNNFGSTVSTQDGAGHAQFSKYAGSVDAAKASQLTLSSKLQNTVVNMVKNGSFEWNDYWVPSADNAAGIGGTYQSLESYVESYSLAISQPEAGKLFAVQPAESYYLTAQPGQTYTLSAYVETWEMAEANYVKNAQGDVTGLVSASGARVVTYTYDAWGNPLSTTGSLAATLGEQNPLRYRGYVYDTETGLYYLQSRYYNPGWGRFINADDTTLLASSPSKAHWDKNVFAYCDNNPLNRVDEDGECWNIIIGGIVGGIVSGASTIVNDAIMGRETTAGSVLESVIVGVIAGGVSAAISVKYDMDILTSMSAGLATLIGSLVTGTGVMESLLAAATAAVSTLLSSRLGSGFSDNIGSGIVSLVTSGNTEGLASVGRGVYKAASRRSQSTQTKKSTAKAKTPIQSPTAPKIPTSADKSLQDWRRTILPPFLQFGGICYAHR